MAGATIDHLVSVTVFLAALLLFISLFNQTIQTAIIYQQHRAIATKCSDLLDNMLLNPGFPNDWGQRVDSPSGFGLQAPEFTQYKLSPFSLMRLRSSMGAPVFYEKTNMTYSNITMGSNNWLLMPYNDVINYSTASMLLGTDGKYGFQLRLIPIVTVSVEETQAANPLRLSVNVAGTGFPLANARVSCSLILVSLTGGAFPSYTVQNRTVYTDELGFAEVEFANVTDANLSYAFIAYAHLSGLNGVGYCERVSSTDQYVIPFVGNFSERTILIAHSYDVHYFSGEPAASVKYNSTFVILTEDFSLSEIPLENATGMVVYGEGSPYGVITLPSYSSGILITTYRKGNDGGVVMMPWGLGSLGFPVVFGGNSTEQEWVTTDMRQVLVNGIAYQANFALWSYEGVQVTG